MALRHPVFEIPEQLAELLREIVGSGLAAVALQREGSGAIGARRAADAEVDAIRK